MQGILLSENEIKSIINSLEGKELKISSHLFRRFPGKLIGEVCEAFCDEYSNEAKERPGLVLLAVILAAHRNYTKQVEPQINRIRKLSFYSFEDLKQRTKNFNGFANFCGMRDLEKYSIITELLYTIDKLKEHYGISSDFDVMQRWAQKANYLNFKEDIIGRIKGVGIATFQHLRMNFGANTVKPDQRVKEVLNREFKFYTDNDIKYISAVEYIAKVIGKSTLYVDQVFVNYGSGYYTDNDNNMEDRLDKKETNQNNTVKPVSTYKQENNIEAMIEYIKNAVRDLNIIIEKRNDEGYILVAKELSYKKNGKNVATYWISTNSISIIILKAIPRTTFYSLDDMKNAQIAEKIRAKYNQMTN